MFNSLVKRVVVVASVASALLFGAVGCDRSEYNKYSDEKCIDIDNISEIIVESVSNHVKIVSSDTESLKISISGKIRVNDGDEEALLEIRTKSEGNRLVIGTGFSKGKQVTSYSGEGELLVEVPKGTDLPLNIKTSSGNGSINNYNGDVYFKSSSGSFVYTTKNLGNNIYAKTSSGSIRLNLPKKSDFEVVGKTSSGMIVTTYSIKDGGRKLNGIVGNGGNKLDLTTASGSIFIY